MNQPPMLAVGLCYERDIVLARQRARHLAALLGFGTQDQTRLATAVSEIARNAFSYGGGGRVEFRIEGATRPQVLVVVVVDQGPGIAHLDVVLDGGYRSPTGMGLGITGARRLVDRFDIRSEPGHGTRVSMAMVLPRERLVDAADTARIVAQLAAQAPRDAVQEVQRQNQELLQALEALRLRQDELVAVNRELEDTNRGVVALYAELDEKADHLRRADEIKTRFISNMTHEFRTPVNSIRALADLLLRGSDGPLTDEQERQVRYIQKAADALSDLVNDLLDLAKVEAGKTVVQPTTFELSRLFGTVRGMLRPLLLNESVDLVFEEPEDVPALHTDEGKVSQILRNFVSNALKFTERGEVRVTGRLADDRRYVRLSVRDSGIGIAPEDQERVFQEFVQVDSPLQRRTRGTGLGLPLCRRLATLLGGRVWMESVPGQGSTFHAELPLRWEPAGHARDPVWEPDPERIPVLVVEDDPDTAMLYEKYLVGSEFQMLWARSLREARLALEQTEPRAVVLDVLLSGEDTWGLLTELRRRPHGQRIPVMIMSMVEDRAKALALGADAYHLKPVDRHRLLHALARLVAPASVRRILIADDDEVARYVLRQHLSAPYRVIEEAVTGDDALRAALEHPPDLICIDLAMPGMSGDEVLRRLRAEPATRSIPVVVVSSRRLDDNERASLLRRAGAVLGKDDLATGRLSETVEAMLASAETP
jgi:signal transduction histidine kinase/CheY-like chemotaxis protein